MLFSRHRETTFPERVNAPSTVVAMLPPPRLALTLLTCQSTKVVVALAAPGRPFVLESSHRRVTVPYPPPATDCGVRGSPSLRISGVVKFRMPSSLGTGVEVSLGVRRESCVALAMVLTVFDQTYGRQGHEAAHLLSSALKHSRGARVTSTICFDTRRGPNERSLSYSATICSCYFRQDTGINYV